MPPFSTCSCSRASSSCKRATFSGVTASKPSSEVSSKPGAEIFSAARMCSLRRSSRRPSASLARQAVASASDRACSAAKAALATACSTVSGSEGACNSKDEAEGLGANLSPATAATATASDPSAPAAAAVVAGTSVAAGAAPSVAAGGAASSVAAGGTSCADASVAATGGCASKAASTCELMSAIVLARASTFASWIESIVSRLFESIDNKLCKPARAASVTEALMSIMPRTSLRTCIAFWMVAIRSNFTSSSRKDFTCSTDNLLTSPRSVSKSGLMAALSAAATGTLQRGTRKPSFNWALHPGLAFASAPSASVGSFAAGFDISTTTAFNTAMASTNAFSGAMRFSKGRSSFSSPF
mmetsp:Transcript_78370/g.219768  ORF Transcript_78370/g.219768 Transcript_78370/m.219768 type:complete len:357 (+) Transcript_78370:981-2051(+)